MHENYHKGTRKNYEIAPLQIREYLNRWYVVGVPEGEKHIKTFGLDRITKLKIKDKTNLDPKDFEKQLAKFQQIVGLNYDAAEKLETVQLLDTAQQYKYLQSLPMHSSQESTGIRNDGRYGIAYTLIPNFEFKMQVLKMGSAAEVLSPKWLREEIEEQIMETLKLYTNE